MLRYVLPVGLLIALVGLPLHADEPNAKNHWAFKTPVRPGVPTGSAWVKNPIDTFIFARSRRKG